MVYIFDHIRYCTDIVLDAHARKRELRLNHCHSLN